MNELIISLYIYKPSKKPNIGDVIGFVTKEGEQCMGIYDGNGYWYDWTDKDSLTTKDIAWWWYPPQTPEVE